MSHLDDAEQQFLNRSHTANGGPFAIAFALLQVAEAITRTNRSNRDPSRTPSNDDIDDDLL
jgi:hypothetical protein